MQEQDTHARIRMGVQPVEEALQGPRQRLRALIRALVGRGHGHACIAAEAARHVPGCGARDRKEVHGAAVERVQVQGLRPVALADVDDQASGFAAY